MTERRRTMCTAGCEGQGRFMNGEACWGCGGQGWIPAQTCGHCDGHGAIPLGPVYRETLDLVRDHPGHNGAELARLAECEATAMNNRLTFLEKLGFVVGVRQGREKRWRADE